MLKNLILKLFLISLISCQKSEETVNYKWPEIIFSNGVKIKVEIAKTEEERAIGLMFRHSIPQDYGMLFIFEKEDYQSFWMKNCFFPLDIIFFNSSFMIVDIKEEFEPCGADPCPTYTSKEKAIYVLEVNSGFCKKNGLKIGDKANFQIWNLH